MHSNIRNNNVKFIMPTLTGLSFKAVYVQNLELRELINGWEKNENNLSKKIENKNAPTDKLSTKL